MKRLFFAVLSISLAACSGAPSSTEAPAVTAIDSAGVQIVSSDLSRVATTCSVPENPRLVVGDREGDPTHELYRVFGGSLLEDGRLALVDQGSQELRFYSPEGELVHAVGREGEGPGEFTNAFLLFRTPGDTLWVGDYRPWAFEVFDPTGAWIRGVRPEPLYPNPPRQIALLPDGRSLLGGTDFAERDRDFGMQTLHVALHGPDGALLDTIGRFEFGRMGQTDDDPMSVWMAPWFESRTLLTNVGNQVALAHGSRTEIRLFDLQAGDLLLDRIIRWSGVDLEVTDAHLAELADDLTARYADMDPDMRRSLVDPLLSDRRPVADRIPAGTSLVAGRDGTLWVAQHPILSGDAGRRWLAFAADGSFACSVVTPPGLEVYEFGSDWVVGARDTELGVETVVVFDLLR